MKALVYLPKALFKIAAPALSIVLFLALPSYCADKIYCGCASLFEGGQVPLQNHLNNAGYKGITVRNEKGGMGMETNLVEIAKGGNKFWNYYGDGTYIIIPLKDVGWNQYPLAELIEGARKLHEHYVKNGVKMVLWMRYFDNKKISPDSLIQAKHNKYAAVKTNLDTMTINGKSQEIFVIPVLHLSEAAYVKFGPDAWKTDGKHMTGFGKYGVATLIFTYLTGKDPRVFGGSSNNKWCQEKSWELYNSMLAPSKSIQIGGSGAVDLRIEDFLPVVEQMQQAGNYSSSVSLNKSSGHKPSAGYILNGRKMEKGIRGVHINQR